MTSMSYFDNLMSYLPYLALAGIPALTFHEWGHAAMANYFGDPTAKNEGRLSLNPLAHLDPMGTILIVLVGFGWAKPVPTNPANYKNSWGQLWVAAAGPLMNIALGILFAILINTNAYLIAGPENSEILYSIFLWSLRINLVLAFFNLIPIGPLDGHWILARLLPPRKGAQFMEWNMRVGGTILFGAIFIDMIFNVGIFRLLLAPAYIAQALLIG